MCTSSAAPAPPHHRGFLARRVLNGKFKTTILHGTVRETTQKVHSPACRNKHVLYFHSCYSLFQLLPIRSAVQIGLDRKIPCRFWCRFSGGPKWNQVNNNKARKTPLHWKYPCESSDFLLIIMIINRPNFMQQISIAPMEVQMQSNWTIQMRWREPFSSFLLLFCRTHTKRIILVCVLQAATGTMVIKPFRAARAPSL